MPAATQTKNLNDGQLIIKDGGGSAEQSVTIAIDAGDLDWTETYETHTIHARRSLKPAAKGRDQEMDVSFTLAYIAYKGDTGETTPVDALTQAGEASDWVSVEDHGPYAVDLEFRVTSGETGVKHEKFIFPNFRKTSIQVTEGEDYTKIKVTGKCRATAPTVTRVSSF